MWRHSYNEDWERKKSYLIRSLFHDVEPLLSPVPEEPDDSSDAPPRPPSPIAYHPYSPLPPLIIEREPNRHDEPEEYYRVLAVKIRRIYKKMLIAGRQVTDSDLIDDFDINNDLNVTDYSVNDSNHVSMNGYSADHESYESEVASDRVERSERNDNHIERDESNDSPSDANNNTDENKSSETASGETDNGDFYEKTEVVKEMIIEIVQEELAEEVGSDNTEDKSGSDYRQITTEAQIHADGNQVEIQSCIYEGSERSVILTSRPLQRVEAEQGQESERSEVQESEETMTDEETVILEDNEDPEDVHMTHNEPVEEEAEMSENIDEIEVMRTPLPKISIESIAHAVHRPSDVSTDLNVMHHASLMTSETDASRTMSPNLNEDEDYVTRRRRKSRDTIDTDALSHVSPILNVPSNVYRTSKDIEEQVTSDMDITCPISNFNEEFIKTTVFIDRGAEKIPSETHVEAPHLNVESLIEEDQKNLDENRQREPREITSDTEVLRYEDSVNDDAVMDSGRDRERMTGTSPLNENRGRKRRADDVGVQAVVEGVAWEDLKMNFFVGTPKIFKLCNCSDHVCI